MTLAEKYVMYAQQSANLISPLFKRADCQVLGPLRPDSPVGQGQISRSANDKFASRLI